MALVRERKWQGRRGAELIGGAVLLLIAAAALFAAAGSLSYWRGWLFLGVTGLGLGLQASYVNRRNPELRAHRQGIGAGTPRWDMVWNTLFWPLMIAEAVVGAWNAGRAGETGPAWLTPLGVALFAGGLVLSGWAMATNKFFEGTARLQTDRNQEVVDRGPYRLVRHPGYLGLILWALSIPLQLGSLTGLIAAAVTVA